MMWLQGHGHSYTWQTFTTRTHTHVCTHARMHTCTHEHACTQTGDAVHRWAGCQPIQEAYSPHTSQEMGFPHPGNIDCIWGVFLWAFFRGFRKEMTYICRLETEVPKVWVRCKCHLGELLSPTLVLRLGPEARMQENTIFEVCISCEEENRSRQQVRGG